MLQLKTLTKATLWVFCGALLSACGGGKDEPQLFTVTASAGSGGSISPGTRSVQGGQTTSFTVTADSGYNIAGVTGCNGSLSGNTYTTGAITVACTVQASFNLNSYTVTATAGEGGSISPGSAVVAHGESTSFTVTVDNGYSLSSVTGCNGSLSGNTYTTGAITSACSIQAIFNLNSHTVTASASEGGSISPETLVVTHGAIAEFTVAAERDYTLASITGCGGSLSGSTYRTAPVTTACSVTANFAKQVIAGELPEVAGNLTASVINTDEVYFHADTQGFIPVTGHTASPTQAPPAGWSFPYGLFDFTAVQRVAGGSAIITLSYPVALPENFSYYKFGPSTAGAAPGWYVLPASYYEVSADRKTLTLTIFDGQLGDSDGEINGIIKDPGGPALQQQYNVTATAGEGGSISPGSAVVNHGSSTSFSVTPQTGFSIASVTGCNGSLAGNTYTTGAITSACSVSASFSLNSYTVSATAGEGGSISPGSAVVNHGSSTSFNVTPQTGFSIASVTGCNGSLAGNTYTTGAITSACSVSASFSQNSFTVSASAGEGGAISPASRSVLSGQTTTFIVTADTGYSIASVTGCSGSLSGNTYTTGAITSACSVSASFSLNSYTVSASAGEGGSISPGSAVVNHGSSTSFSVTPQTGFSIASVTGCNGSLSGNTYTTGAITGACSVSASFSQNSFTVSASAGEGGAISPASRSVLSGQTTTFTVTADSGFSIASVTGCNGSLSGNTYTTGAITSACSVSASFSQNSFTVSASAGEGGAISPASRSVLSGQTTTFTVTADTGYSIASVTGCNGSLSGNTYTTGAITSACSVSASFSQNSFTVSASAGEGGAISPASRSVLSGQTTTFTVTADTGYSIASVTGCNGSLSGNTYTTGAITGACSVNASFSQNSFTVSATAGEGGAISPASRSVLSGQTTTFTVTADTGFSIASVTGCNGSLSGNTYTTGAITGACSVSASFSQNSFTVSASAGEGGAISPASRSVLSGQSTTFAVTADTGYSIASVTGCNGTLSGNTYTTGAITSACSVTASFSQNSYMVTAIATEGGQITPGSLSVLHGQTAQFSVVADDNHRIVEVTGCGGSLAGETYTTGAITAACTIDASFAFVPIGGLNDTGIDWCANANTNNLDCPVAGFEGQDGEFGRDAMARAGTLTKIGGGAAGFDYTKIAADGSVLAIQDEAWDANGTEAAGSQWSCVRDNVTGLIWEVKTNDGGLRDMNHTYTWYNPDSSTNGGDAGVQNGGQCTGSDCDTHAFVQAVNSQGLCGANNWRMPTKLELMGIVHNGRVNPVIDTAYFPNTAIAYFWSFSPYAGSRGGAWAVVFNFGYDVYLGQVYDIKVRLVLGGQYRP